MSKIDFSYNVARSKLGLVKIDSRILRDRVFHSGVGVGAYGGCQWNGVWVRQ